MKTKNKTLVFVILIVFLQLLSSCVGSNFWWTKYGLNKRTNLVEEITHKNKYTIQTVKFLTKDAFDLSMANPASPICFHSQKVNHRMVSFFSYQYDIEYSKLVSNAKGEIRLIQDFSPSNKRFTKISWLLILFYICIVLLLFYFVVDYGRRVIIFWLLIFIIGLYLIHLFMPGGIITMVWLGSLFLISLTCGFISRNIEIYIKHFHCLSFIIVIIAVSIILYKVYEPLLRL